MRTLPVALALIVVTAVSACDTDPEQYARDAVNSAGTAAIDLAVAEYERELNKVDPQSCLTDSDSSCGAKLANYSSTVQAAAIALQSAIVEGIDYGDKEQLVTRIREESEKAATAAQSWTSSQCTSPQGQSCADTAQELVEAGHDLVATLSSWQS